MHIVVGVIVKKDNKILMVQEAQKKHYGLWNMPAGLLDEKEDIFLGAKREFKEETGYDVKLTGMLPIENYVNDNVHAFLILFHGEITGGEISFDKDELLDVKWFTIEELKAMTDKEIRDIAQKKNMLKNIEKGIIHPLEIIENILNKK